MGSGAFDSVSGRETGPKRPLRQERRHHHHTKVLRACCDMRRRVLPGRGGASRNGRRRRGAASESGPVRRLLAQASSAGGARPCLMRCHGVASPRPAAPRIAAGPAPRVAAGVSRTVTCGFAHPGSAAGTTVDRGEGSRVCARGMCCACSSPTPARFSPTLSGRSERRQLRMCIPFGTMPWSIHK